MIYNVKTVTSRFLFGKDIPPIGDALLSEKWINRSSSPKIVLSNSDYYSYMTTGPGRFANASQISLVDNFFDWQIPADLLGNTQEFTLSEALTAFGGSINQILYQSDYKNKGGQEWAERVYLHQTQSYALNQKVKFHIDSNGNKYIENFALMLNYEDFDFDGGFWSNIGNAIIEPDIDPYKIGKTVNFKYPSSIGSNYHNQYGGRYTIDDYYADITRYDKQNHGTLAEVYSPIMDLVDSLWDSGITKFVDSKGRAIVYGDGNNNNLGVTSLRVNTKMREYWFNNKEKGLAIVAGGGNDTLIGTDYDDLLNAGTGSDTLSGKAGNDILEGKDGNDNLDGGSGDDYLDGGEGADTLKGGAGNDTYIANDGDTIRDSDHTGKVEFNDITLAGGEWDTEKELYIDKSNSNITYNLQDSTLTVSNGNESITINDYDKEKESLGIILEKSIDIEVSISDVTVNEQDGIATLTVSINEKLDEDLILKLNTSNGSASSEDYVALSQHELIIKAGEKEATLEVEISDDEEKEETENFTVNTTSHDYEGKDLNDIDYGQGSTVTIEDDDEAVKVSIENTFAYEGDTAGQSIGIRVNLSKAIKDKSITISTNLGNAVIAAGSTEGTIRYEWAGNKVKDGDKNKTINITNSSQLKENNIEIASVGSLTIKDDDDDCDNPKDCDPDPKDPLVLDINKDGLISTISLEDSNAYFDLTGDGEKEKVGWIGGEDALLVYDENENGVIDGINEVFGNDKLSGFTELKNKIDSNYDGKIDRQDELFYQLQTWHDYDGDGNTDEGELKSLKEAGVVSINTEVFNTNIEVDGNILTEASRYTDSEGNLELAADLLLQYEGSIFENTDETSLGIEVKEEARNLPSLKAGGYVLDSEYAYSTDEKLLTMAQEFSSDIGKIANNFDEFISQWSGFYDMAENKGIQKEQFTVNTERNLSIKLWVLEKFKGFRRDSWRTEAHLGGNLYGRYHNQPFGNPNVIQDNYSKLINKYESLFAIQTIYKDIFTDTIEQNQQFDYLVIDNPKVLIHRISKYINDSSVDFDKRLYLASIIKKQENWASSDGLGLDFEAIKSRITDTYVKNIVSKILNDEVNLLIKTDETTFFENDALIVGTNEDNLIETTKNFSYQNGKATIIAGLGYDRIITAEGETKYIYNMGDGVDIIYDKGGNDTLQFNGINEEDIEIQKSNSDLIIGIKETGVAFSELSNKIVIKDFMKIENQIENIVFQDGSSLNIELALQGLLTTEYSDYIDLSNSISSLNIDSRAGNDTILTGNNDDILTGNLGDDILKGGKGNDTYIFNIGDGKDTILDTNGIDIINFGENITSDDLIIKVVDSDILIALKEDGVIFDNLSDKITVSNIDKTTVKTIKFNDGTNLDIESFQEITSKNNNLYFTENDISLDALEGDDIITTSGGKDSIIGNTGNDIIFTGTNDDTLEGGLGNDSLQGGLGNDTYIFNIGDGKDIIDDSFRYGYKNSRSKNAGNDTLLLGEGITKDNLEIKLNGNDITLAIKENDKIFEEYTDSITIKNWLDTNSKIENILLSDDTNIVLKELQSITEGDDTLVYDNSDIIVDSLGGNDTVITGSGNDIIVTGEGNDNVISRDGFDVITAGDGNDIIDSGKGNDIIDSGKGNDTLQGALGNDTYIFNLGDGVDTILDYYRYGSAGNDTIKFGENITLDKLSAIANGNDLTISYSDTDKVIVKNYFNTNYKIENILLYDETSLSLEQIQKATIFDDTLIFDDASVTIDLLDGNDIVSTGNGDDIVNGNSGDDLIKTNSGIDSISGGLGSDTIYSGDGNDTIQGNEGNDNLQGGLGNDTYIFNVGDGTDTIYDDYRYRNKQKFAGTDTIQFGEGINQDSLVAQGSGNDLIIAIKEVGKSFDELIDKIIIKNWANVNNRIENIKLLDGSLIALESIQIGTLEDDYLLYGDEGITSNGFEGNDIIISGNGDDTITGGLGNDILKAGLGNDIYIFNKGDGEDSIIDIGGRDTIKFGENILKDDLIIKREEDDLIIAINEANILYENLADKIIIKGWFKLTNNIETIEFFDGTILSSAEIADYFVEDKLSSFLYSKIGATLLGETGDDTYVYNKGDFTVIIDDSKKESDIDVQAGYDKLILNGGINKEDVTIGISDNNLIINISTDTTYEELMDRIVVRNWQDENKGIEEIIFSDGEVIQINKDEIFPELNYNEEWNTNNTYILGEEDNHYTGTTEDEIIYAGKGNDNLDSGLGDDTLIGEYGNDLLEAGAGNDTYVFNKGDGKDTIYDHYFDSRKGIEVDAGNDTLLFKRGITLNDLIIKQNNNDLIIGIKEDSKTFDELSDKIVINNWNNVDTKIETIEFNDGSKISKEEILSIMVADSDDIINTPGYSDQLIYGKKGNDVISTNAGNDTIYSGQGNDIVNIAAGNNIVYGGSGVDSITTGHGIDIIEGGIGNDTINSGYGNDILIGGDGNDTLIGGYGNDTYIYKKGNGFDTISEIGGIDKLLFGANITVDDLILEKEEKNLIILINETGIDYENLTDKIVIQKWFNSSNNIESFEFEDGTILNNTEIASSFDTGHSGTIISKQYANLSGESGNDTYIYNKGDFTVIIDDRKKVSDIDVQAGYDKLVLSGGINREDITLGVNGTNLIINIKNENITSDELKDRVVIENWQDINKGVEEIIFSDGEILQINKNEVFPGVNYSSSWITKKHYIYGEEDNTISLFVGDSTIELNGGNDTIKAGRYNSIIDGGTGDDNLYGDRGDDTYIFKRGYGHDLIIDAYMPKTTPSFYYDAGLDTIDLKDLNLSDVLFMQNNNDLIIAIKEDGKSFEELSDKLTIKYWNNTNTSIETFKFSDGTTFNQDKIRNIMITTNNDTIITTGADDILFGGKGDDTLKGSSGNDTYIYSLGDGIDTIYDTRGIDTIKFKEGILLDDLIVKAVDENLIIAIKEDGKSFNELSNKIILENWEYSSVNKIDFFDGTTSDVESLQVATNNDDYLIYSHDNNFVDALDGNDTVILGNGNDVIQGNKGNDTLKGGSGNDRYIYNLGDGIDVIFDNNGTDTIILGDNINADNLIVKALDEDMVLGISEIGKTFDEFTNKIIIKNWINSSVNNIQFIDGTTSNLESLQSITTDDDYLIYSHGDITINSLDGDDTMQFGNGNDTVNGNGGNDTIFGGSGSNILSGEDGEDLLSSEYGNDILDGGIGNDILEAGNGDDTYIFGRGYGQDVIKDENLYYYYGDTVPGYAGNDTIEFQDSTTIDDLLIQINGTDLVIAIKEDAKTFEELSDKLTIINGVDENYRIENIKFSDGTLLPFTDEQGNYTITTYTENSTPPIVLDMNFNGVTSIALNDSTAYFDYAGDGQREHTSWIEQDDALLVADLNNDGKINDGSELFGTYTKLTTGGFASDGYNALAQYDTNGDLIINHQDSSFSKLSLWSDSNQNGKTDVGELKNIQLSKITAIHLVNEGSTIFEQVTENGNLITNETIYETNSENGIVRDIWFEYDETDYITNNDTLQATNTQKYLSLNDGDDTYIYSLGDGLVTIDDNGDGNDTLKFTQNIKKEQIEIRWDKDSDNLILAIRPIIDDTTAVTELENQILIKDWFKESGSIETISFDDGTFLNKEELFELMISKKESTSLITRVLEKNSELEGGNFNDLLYGALGNELLNGNAGHDYLKGLEGDDHLIGGNGDDTLNGGLGNDLHTDIQGDEYYIYNRGDGKDTIIDAEGNDFIVFAPNIVLNDLIIESTGNNLVIGIREESKNLDELNDIITIENYFLEDNYKIEKIEFYNGLVIDIQDHINTSSNTEIIISNLELRLQEDSNFSGTLEVQGNTDSIQYTIETNSENSNFIIDELGNYTYTPNQDYNGSENIIINVTNKYGDTNSATMTFNVEAVNDTPIANEDTATTFENYSLTINSSDILSNDTDVDTNDILSITNVSAPLNKGIASLDSNGNVLFETGTDFDYLALGESEVITLNYEIQDDKGATSSSTISLTISGSNDAPIIESINTINTLEDSGILTGQVNASDLDNNPTLSFSTTEVIAGFILNSDGTYSFDPSNEDYQSLSEGDIKDITIPVSVTDEYGSTDSKDLLIKVIGTNDTPIANEDTATTFENDSLTINSSDILSNDTDIDTNDILSITNVSAPLNKGIASLDSNGNVLFETGTDFDYLALGESEVITLNYEIQDDKGATSSSTISLTISGSNDAPEVTLKEEEIILTQELIKEGQIQATDIDGDVLKFSILESTLHGELLVDDQGMWVYNVDSTYKGSDSAVVLIDDLKGGTVTKTLNFKVDNTPINGSDNSDILFGDNEKNIINGLGGNDYIYAFGNDDIVLGGTGNDRIYGHSGNDTLLGEEGRDRLYGYIGDDILSGGTGDDYLNGSFGNDTYIFNLGDGNDQIIEYESFYSDDIDTLKFGEGISEDNIKFIKDWNDLVVKISDNDSIRVNNWYSYFNNHKVENISFHDGSSLNIDEVEQKAIIEGTADKDYLHGSNYSDDKLYGLEGNDKIYAYDGNDYLNGGKGNDYLKGGDGDDTYSFKLGDGKDIISDKNRFWKYTTDAGNDTVLFEEGITSSDVLFSWKRNNLIINYSEEDSIKIRSQKNNDKAIENFKLSDGSYLTNNDVENIIQNMISYADENGIDMTNENEIRNNTELMNIVSSSWKAS